MKCFIFDFPFMIIFFILLFFFKLQFSYNFMNFSYNNMDNEKDYDFFISAVSLIIGIDQFVNQYTQHFCSSGKQCVLNILSDICKNKTITKTHILGLKSIIYSRQKIINSLLSVGDCLGLILKTIHLQEIFENLFPVCEQCRLSVIETIICECKALKNIE